MPEGRSNQLHKNKVSRKRTMRVDRAERFFRGCRRTLAALTALTLVAACTPRPNEDLARIDAPAGDMVGDNVELQRDYVLGHHDLRSEERMVGNEWERQWTSWGAPVLKKNKNKIQ